MTRSVVIKAVKEILDSINVGTAENAYSYSNAALGWIENVLEELDHPEEWYYDGVKWSKLWYSPVLIENTKILYYFFNSTGTPSGQDEFVATQTKVIFNITGKSQAEPVSKA